MEKDNTGSILTSAITEVPEVIGENPTLCQWGRRVFARQAASRNDKIHMKILQTLSSPQREKPYSSSAQTSVPTEH